METIKQRIGDFVVTYSKKNLYTVLIPTDLPIYRNAVTGVIVAQAIILIDDNAHHMVLTNHAVLVVFPDKNKVLYKDRSFEEVCNQFIWI